ncbi:Transcription factor ILR3-like protein [Drosera capensis]
MVGTQFLEAGRPPKTDKAAVLSDAVRIVTQLRTESQNLKESNSSLKENIKDLKAEKNELHDEKQRLKAEKARLELQLKSMSALPGFLPPPRAGITAFAPQAPPAGAKLVPLVSYPGLTMWQFMPPAAVDTSQDHALRHACGLGAATSSGGVTTYFGRNLMLIHFKIAHSFS